MSSKNNVPGKEFKELQEKFNKLCNEQEALFRPEFEKVFDALFKLDTSLLKNYPCTNNKNNINKAIEIAGFSNDTEFCEAFTQYNQIFIEGKEIQLKGIEMIAKEHSEKIKKEPIPNGWRFFNFSFITSPQLHDILNNIIETDGKKGKGLFANITEIKSFDESIDGLMDVEVYGIKCTMQPFVRDLEKFNVIDSLFKKHGFDFKRILTILKIISDFIKEYSTEPNKVRNYIAGIIKDYDSIPIWGLFSQILLFEGLCYWCSGVSEKIGQSNDGYNDVLELWKWIEKLLTEKLIKFTYTPYGDNDKLILKPFCDFLYDTELGQCVQKTIFNTPEQLEPEQPKTDIKPPKELTNPKAKEILNKAIEAGFCEVQHGFYKWDKDKQLLAYFVEKVSLYLELRKGRLDKDGKQTISWKPFEQLFKENKIQSAKASFMKYNTKFTPPGYTDIDLLFN